jgi:hypothetical protein
MSEDSPQPAAPQPPSQWQYNPQEDTKASPGIVSEQHLPSYQPDAPQYVGSSDSQMPESKQHDHDEVITWTASEFIAHHKDIRWYMAVLGITAVLAVIARLLTHDNITTTMLVIIGIVFCITAARKPRVLTYMLDDDGVHIGERFIPYTEFRSFSIISEGPFSSIELLPLKRFMPMTSIYCSPETEDDAIDMLADFLPYEERGHNLVDAFARRIRF